MESITYGWSIRSTLAQGRIGSEDKPVFLVSGFDQKVCTYELTSLTHHVLHQ